MILASLVLLAALSDDPATFDQRWDAIEAPATVEHPPPHIRQVKTEHVTKKPEPEHVAGRHRRHRAHHRGRRHRVWHGKHWHYEYD